MRYFTGTFAALALIAVLASTPAAPAWADDRSDCVRAAGTGRFQPIYAADLGIAACTRLIESGRLIPESLPIVYYNRGIIYGRKRQYDLAIADYTRAIALNPNYGAA